MALFKSALITQASGSIFGMTFSHNRGGAYIRARTVPTNPGSAYQSAVRGFLSQLVNHWQDTLTPEEREAWQYYAENVSVPNALGDPVFLSGLNHYVRANVPRLQAGLTRVDVAPVTFNLALLTNPSFTADASDDDADVAFTNTDEWATAVGGALLCFFSRPVGKTINYFKGPYRYAGKVAGAVVPPTTPATIALPFEVAEGHRIFGKFLATTADGRLSVPFRGSTDAAA